MVNMTFRNRKRLLWSLNLLLAGVLGFSVYGLAVRPLPLAVPEPQESPTAPAMAQEPAAREPLSAYAVIYQRDLGKPLFDVQSAAKPAAPAAKLSVTLVGTAVEPGFTYALLRDGSGQVKMVSVGETIEGAELTAVADGAVTMNFAGQSVTLTLDKSGGKP